MLPGKDEFPEKPGFPEWPQQGDKPKDIVEHKNEEGAVPKSAPPPQSAPPPPPEEEEKPKEMNRGPPSMANICAPWDESEQQEAPKTITESSLCENPQSPNSPPAAAAAPPPQANLPKDDGEASATQEPSEDNEKGPNPWEDEVPEKNGKPGPSENETGAGGIDDYAAQLKNMEEEYRQKNPAVGR